MCSRQILFSKSSPYIIDTSNCNSQPYSAFFQSGGKLKNKKVTSIDTTKQFMYMLLKFTKVDSKISKELALNNCFNDLIDLSPSFFIRDIFNKKNKKIFFNVKNMISL